MKEKIIGILGGMGPDATCVLFQRIISLTNAKSDNEHIRIIIDNNPKIPDRTSAILKGTNSPVPELIKTAVNLENAGVDFVIIPCITSHYFFDDIQKEISVPILNALQITKEHIDKEHKSINKIGVIATSGTIKTNLFQKMLENKDIIIPTDEEQEELVMKVIYGEEGVKAGNRSGKIKTYLSEIVHRLKERGAEAIISGCTEISIVLDQADIDIPLIDPLTLMAKKSVSAVKDSI
ncbi:aspartate racemase [Proteiniborus ethanoligenes]|uniref:Aspartate racemase n=1 Tax=Proteiniborus ethanoligenes TaxID=415015 RepID=A0A1H3Q9T6_9FIRM|nr:amino acid racemase [Proteiniborus ethanoligenes]TAH63206.1 MAG: amino acid racemase [Gottschalkiaceae bacterium]SDZ10304.1 aspartate racemase [Proteiniborus ethanoligenes]